MASVDWKKNKGGTNEGMARMSHATRHDGRDVEYNNKEINKELSHLNYTLGDNVVEARTAKEEVERLKKRVSELDKIIPPQRVRKDRVTTVSFSIPAPEGLREEDEKQFFAIAYSEITKMCGGIENVSRAYIHKDEIHEYYDSRNKQFVTSRPHMHLQGIAWTDEKGVNGKYFSRREQMTAINNKIDERCKIELGISFLKGDLSQHDRNWRAVEDLKIKSAKALKEEISRLETQAREQDKQAEILTRKIDYLEYEKIELENKVKRDNDVATRIMNDKLLEIESLEKERDELFIQKRALEEVSITDKWKRPLIKGESTLARKIAEELTIEKTKSLSKELADERARSNKYVSELRGYEKRNAELSQENKVLQAQVEHFKNVANTLKRGVERLLRVLGEKARTLFWDKFREEDKLECHNFREAYLSDENLRTSRPRLSRNQNKQHDINVIDR